MIYQLVYVSTAAYPLSDRELNSLVADAVRKNKTLGITGMLLYREPYFLQLLEGDEEYVEKLFETIKADTRHDNLFVLTRGKVAAREFEHWAMAHVSVTWSQCQEMENDLRCPGAGNLESLRESSTGLAVLKYFFKMTRTVET